MQTHMAVAHFAFQFGTRHQGGHRIDHQHVDGAGAHQSVGDFQGLLAGIGLADQQFVQIDAQLLGVDRVQRVFGVDEGAGAALLLGLGQDVERQGGLTRAFRSINFDDAAARQAADAKGDVQAQRAGGDHLGLDGFLLPHLHDGALAERPLDLADGGFQCLLTIHGVLIHETQRSLRHGGPLGLSRLGG